MHIIIIVCAILGLFIVFSILKKLIKWILIFTSLLIVTVLGGYFFLTGDGSLTQDILPSEVQQEINTVRDSTNQKIKDKATEVKEAAVDKASETTDKAVQAIQDSVEESIKQSKERVEGSLSDTLNKNDADGDSIEDQDIAKEVEDLPIKENEQ